MSRKLWNSLIVLLILAGTMPVAADTPPTTGADVPLALMPAWAAPLRTSAAGQPTGGVASAATHLWQPEAGPTPPAPEGEPGWEQPFPTPPPEEMEEPEQPADPRYIPVLPPDPERESQEQPPEEPEQGPPKAPSAATASDCTAESDLDITNHSISDPPAPGHEVEYQITVESQGNAAARDVRITDTLPMSVTYVSDTPPTGFTTAITTGGQVVWERQVPLNPSEIVVGSVRVRVNDTAIVGGILTNTVVVTTSDPDVNPADNHNTRNDTIVTPTRDLYVAKYLNSGIPIPGTQIEYLLQFENNGNYTAHDVVLTDTLPPSVTYVSWYGYMYNPGYYDLDANIVPTIANGQIVWPLGDLVANCHGYVYLTVRITDTAPPTGILTNTAVITTSDQEANPGDNTATRSDSVITPTRDLQVTKSLSLYSNEPITGAQVEYKLWVKNNGNVTAHDVVLTDTLPPSVTYVSWYGHSYNPSYYDLDANIVPTIANGQIVWPLGNLVAGGRGYIYLTVQITDTAPVGGVLTNTIVVTTSDQETSPGDESDTLASTIVTPTRDVQIAKYLYDTALPGETIQYQLLLQNTGNATAHDVVLTDTLSPSATYVSWSGYGSGQVTPTVANGQIVWHLGNVPAGTNDSIYLTVQITDTAPVGGILTNTAAITTSDPDTNSTNNTTTRYDPIANPTRDLQVTKSLNSGTPLPGAQIEYQLYFKNNGNATAHDVVLTDTLPPSVTYVSWSGHGSGQITPTVANGQVVWQLGEVSGGQNDSIYLTVQIDDSASPGALLTNTAVITTSDPDTAPNNDADTLTTTVMTPTSDLLVSKSLYSWHTHPIAGNNIKYRLYFRNTGKTDAHDVLLTDTLPAEVSYVSWYGYMYNPSRYDLDANIVPTIVNGQIIWPLGDVGVGHFGYIFVTVHISDTASARDVLCNHAAISSPVEDSDPGNNVFTHTLTVYYPTVDLAVDKSLFGEPGAPGGNMEYRIVLDNNGTAAAHNVLLTDTLPPSVTLVSWSGGASTVTETADGKLVWPIGTLAAESRKYLYVTVHLDDALNVGDLLTNTISVSSSDTDLDERDNADTVVTTVSTPTRDLLVTKGLDSDLVPGEQAWYWVRLSNQGNFTATGVILTDTLPPSVTLASWIGLFYNPERLLPAPDVQDGQLVWHIGELKAGQHVYIYLYAPVDEGVAPGTALTNTAVVSLAETDANPDDNEAQYRAVAIAPERDLIISKQEADLPALPDGETTFRISFKNNGNARAKNVLITDTLPTGVAYVSWYGNYYDSYVLNAPLQHLITPSISGQQVVWHIPEMEAGASGNIYLTVRVSDTVALGTSLVNTVVITSDAPDADIGDNSDVCTSTVAQVWDANVSKSLPGSPSPGDDVEYSIYFSNDGNMPLTNLVISDTWPVSATYVSWEGVVYKPSAGYQGLPMCDDDATLDLSKHRGRWEIETLQPGEYGYIYLSLHLGESISAGIQISNVVTISSTETDSDLSNNIYTTTTTIVPPVPTRDVQVNKQVSIPGAPGGLLHYRIYFRNSGSDAAHDVVLTDTLPSGISYVSWFGYGEGSITPTVTGQQVVWPLGTLEGYRSGYIYLVARISDSVQIGDRLVNQARISTSDSESNYSNNQSSKSYTVFAQPDLAVIKYKNTEMGTGGGWMQYGIQVENQGAYTATNIVLTDTLPLSTSLAAWDGRVCHTDMQQGDWSCDTLTGTASIVNGQVRWDLNGELPPAGFIYLYATVEIEDQAAVWQPLSNEILITCDEVEDEYNDNMDSDSARVLMPFADPWVEKYAGYDDFYSPGEQVLYYIYLYNSGNITATNTLITDVLPSGIEYTSWWGDMCAPLCVSVDSTITPTISDGEVVWNIGDLPPGAYGYFYLMGRITDTVAACTILTNTALIAGDGDSYLDNNISRIPIRVGQPVSLTGVTIYGPDTVLVGQVAVFTTTVSPVTATVSQYTWSSDNLVGGQNTSSGLYSWSRAGRYTITVRAENSLGAVTDTHVVTVVCNALTEAAITGPTEGYTNTTYSFSAVITPSDASTPVTYTWTPTPTGGQGGQTAHYSWATTGTRTITLVVQNCGGQVTATHTIAIVPLPAGCPHPLIGAAIVGPTKGYTGTAYSFSAVITPSDATAPVTYTWTPAPDSGQGTANATYSWAMTGTQTITLVVWNCGGRFTVTHDIAIASPPAGCPNPLTEAAITGPTEGYTGTTYSFSAVITPSNATMPVTYTWTPAPDSGQGTANAGYSWNTAGPQTITLVAQNCGGRFTATHTIVITTAGCPNPLRGVSISGPTKGYTGTTYHFSAIVTPSNATLLGPVTYEWSPTPDSGQGTWTANYSWATTGTYTITLVAHNCGGWFTATHRMLIIPVMPLSTTVGPGSGGMIIYTDTQGLTTTVHIPAGAVTEVTTIVFTPVPSPTEPVSGGLRFGNHAFDINAYRNGQMLHNFSLQQPVTVTIHYSDADVAGLDESTLALYRWIPSPGYWERIGERLGEGQALYAALNTLKAWLMGFSRFGTFGAESGGHRLFLPVVLRNY